MGYLQRLKPRVFMKRAHSCLFGLISSGFQLHRRLPSCTEKKKPPQKIPNNKNKMAPLFFLYQHCFKASNPIDTRCTNAKHAKKKTLLQHYCRGSRNEFSLFDHCLSISIRPPKYSNTGIWSLVFDYCRCLRLEFLSAAST